MPPWIVRRLLLPVHEATLRRPTFAYLRLLEESQWWSFDRLRELQKQKLRLLLQHSIRKTPYYKERLSFCGFNPATANVESLEAIPTLSKVDIRDNIASMTDLTVPGGLIDCATGGSTGTPLQFKMCRRRQAADQAARARTRQWFGIDIGDRELYLWGSPVEINRQDRMKQVRDRLTNHRLLNAFELNDLNMGSYLKVLRDYDPVHVFGYPSSLVRWAKFTNENGGELNCPSLKAIFTTGEVLNDADREILENSAHVPVADGYGARDAGFIAHQCLAGRYHVTMESMIVELLDAKQREVLPGQIGEITVTHLDSFGMPLIRYRTGDMARRGSQTCTCGRGLETLESIDGRQTDMLRRPDGGYAHALSLIYVIRETNNVESFQIEQQPDLSIDLQLVARGEISATEKARLAAAFRKQLGGAIETRVHQVSTIATAASGKHRHVVSRAC